MIKINLLGKKKAQTIAGLGEVLARVGINPEDVIALQPIVLKVIVVAGGLYLANYIPEYILQTKIHEVDKKIEALQQKSTALQKELDTKKELRTKMSELEKEEAVVNRKLSAIEGLSKDRSIAFHTLNNLTSVLPEKVWINKLDYDNLKITLDGSSWEYFPINDFVKSLYETTQFENVNLKMITAEPATKVIPGIPLAAQKTKNFQVEFNVKKE